MNDEDTAFAKLTQSELTLVGTLGAQVDFSDREILFRAGEAKIDLFVVLEGSVDIVNPADANRLVVTHDPGSFIGDIDLLTGRPVLVTAIARGKAKNHSSSLQQYSIATQSCAKFWRKAHCWIYSTAGNPLSNGCAWRPDRWTRALPETNLAREFLYKNFVPFTWHAPESALGEQLVQEANAEGNRQSFD